MDSWKWGKFFRRKEQKEQRREKKSEVEVICLQGREEMKRTRVVVLILGKITKVLRSMVATVQLVTTNQ